MEQEPELSSALLALAAEEPDEVMDAYGGHMTYPIRSALIINDVTTKPSTYLTVDLYFSPRIKKLKSLMANIATHVELLAGNQEQESSEFDPKHAFYNKRDLGESDTDESADFCTPPDWKTVYDEVEIGHLDFWLWNGEYSEELEDATRLHMAKIQSSVYLEFPTVGRDEFAIDYTILTIPSKKRRLFQPSTLFKSRE
jgi:hypothetical protein